ncbi:MAG: hypothetical protein PHU06_00595 [Gallionella sp.]|nr:hypothetical protein [Gallionella sp.]MDD4957758.1 hypothetical protein [Gallionella sp.]
MLLLVLLSSGIWSYGAASYFEYLKQEQVVADMIRSAEEQASINTGTSIELLRRRSEANAKLQIELTQCQVAAEKAKVNYLNLNQQPMPNQSGEYFVTRTVMDEADKIRQSGMQKCEGMFYMGMDLQKSQSL